MSGQLAVKVAFLCICKHRPFGAARRSGNSAKSWHVVDGGICIHLAMVRCGEVWADFGWSISNFAIFGELTLDRVSPGGTVEWRI